MFTERHAHHLDQTHKIARVRLPVVKIRQVNLSIVVDVHADFDVHVSCRLHIADRGVIRMRVHQPNADRDVISVF